MWVTLQVTHNDTIDLKNDIMNTLTHEYKLFRMKHEETIQDMEKYFIHIVNHLITLGKIFIHDYLINKVLLFLNHIWKPKVNVIYESKDLSYMDLTTSTAVIFNTKMKLKMKEDLHLLQLTNNVERKVI